MTLDTDFLIKIYKRDLYNANQQNEISFRFNNIAPEENHCDITLQIGFLQEHYLYLLRTYGDNEHLFFGLKRIDPKDFKGIGLWFTISIVLFLLVCLLMVGLIIFQFTKTLNVPIEKIDDPLYESLND